MTFKNITSSHFGKLGLLLAVFLVLAVAFGFYVHSEKQIDRANDQRQQSFLLADQLRQSSDDLTRMARTYVATSDPRYKNYYQDILDIRDGRKPRPEGYFLAYWDLVLADKSIAQAGSGSAIALLELMRQAGFSEDEFRKVAEAKKHSDDLAAIELEAMRLMDAAGPDAPDNQAKARLMLHDASYHQAKAAIMQPIDEFYILMDRRTADSVHTAERMAIVFRNAFIACVLGAMFVLWRMYVALRRTLGASAEEVHTHIRRIGQGDLLAEIAVEDGMKGSVLAGLAEMQEKLKAYELERRQNEEQLLASRDRLEEAQRLSHIGSWTLDLTNGKLIWSNEVFRLFEIDPNEFEATYEAFLNAIHPEDRAAGDKAYSDSLANRMPYEITHRLRMQDGRIKWVHERCLTDFDSEGKPLRSTGTIQDVTDRKLIDEELKEAQQKLESIVRHIPAMVFLKRASDLRFELFNRGGEELLGYSANDLLGKNDYDFFPQEQADFFTAQDRKVLASKEVVEIPEEKITTAGGEVRYLHTRKIALRSSSGEATHLLGISVDITERKLAEVELRIAAIAFESQEGMMVTDANSVILRVNRAFTELTGYTAEEAVGQTPRILKSGRHDDDFYRSMWKTIKLTGGWQGEIWDRRKNGEEYPKWVTISAVKDRDGVVTHYIGTNHDITERKLAEERIKYLAFHDQLTGLPNRSVLLDRMKQAMAASSRSGNHAALMFIDLDRFKTLNDTLGHDMGDLLLKQVAQRLTICVRAGDTVVRLGGDEFVVMLADLSASEAEARSQANAVGEKILAELNQVYLLKEISYHSTPSIGVTMFRGIQNDIDILLKQADLAMYKSKEAGRNAMRFFDSHMEADEKKLTI